MEVAVDDVDAANPRLMFVRIGTDDASGRIRTSADQWLTLDGSIQTFSLDGHIDSEVLVSFLPATANVNGHRITGTTAWVGGLLPIPIDLGGVEYLDFGTAGDGPGPTDLYISFANLITDSRNQTNATSAFNPRESGATTIPGRGAWLHFQQLFARALLNAGRK